MLVNAMLKFKNVGSLLGAELCELVFLRHHLVGTVGAFTEFLVHAYACRIGGVHSSTLEDVMS